MKRGFTLAELMLAAAILAFVLSGQLLVFVNCILLNESSRNLTLAYSAIQMRMEELKNIPFDSLDAQNGNFNLNGFPSGTAIGTVQVTPEPSTYPDFKRINIRACYRNRNRLIGYNLTSCQSSGVELTTRIVRP